jgi:hypothetical protein
VPDVSDLALGDEVSERLQRLLDVDAGVRAVQLIEVYPVCLQPPQRVLDGAHYPAARSPAAVGVFPHRVEELGGEDGVVAATLERFADDFLGLAGPVDVGGVGEVDASVEGGVDDADGLVVVGVAPRTRTSSLRGTSC